MKINKKPIHIIQAFKNSYKYSKEYKDFDKRKPWVKWKEKIYSESVILDDKVVVSKSYYENRVGILNDFLILLDNNYSEGEFCEISNKIED